MAITEEQTSHLETDGNQDGVAKKSFLPALGFLLALIPIVNIFWIITTVGCDNVSNDYLTYAHLIDSMMSGEYPISHLVQDTFYRGHATTLAFLTHLASAMWFSGSVMPELYLGFLMALARLAFWYDALRVHIKIERTWWLLPALSFFVFSNSQISLFTYPGATLPIGISLFGQSLGIWSLARFKTSWRGVCFATLGGLISCYSWGIGPVTWAILLTYFAFLAFLEKQVFKNTRATILQGLALLTGAAISAIPYVMSFFANSESTGAISATKTIVSLFNLKVIINMLGWPLANEIAESTGDSPEAKFAGIAALVMTGALLFCLMLNRRTFKLANAQVPLLLLLCGFLGIWEISMVRSLLAPWYTPLAIPFWAGLLGTAAYIFNSIETNELNPGTRNSIALKCAMLTVVVSAACYARSNQTWQDKTYLMKGRAPASYSALYHAETAPTYADQYVFLWTPGSPSLLQKLAEVMKKHQISVFGPVQKLMLQGDFMLSSVSTDTEEGAKSLYFTDNLSTLKRSDWSDYEKLDLVMPPGNTINWQLKIPKDLIEGSFNTRFLSVLESEEKKIEGSPSVAAITLRMKDGKTVSKMLSDPDDSKSKGGSQYSIDLKPYGGKEISIELSTDLKAAKNHTWIFRKPQVVFVREREKKATRDAAFNWMPDNTECGTKFPARSPEDQVIGVSNPTTWTATAGEVTRAGESTQTEYSSGLRFSSTANDATFKYKKHLAISINEFKNLVFNIAAQDSMKLRVLKITLQTSDPENKLKSFFLPLLGGSFAHDYKYPTRLLNLPSGTTVEGLSFKTMDSGTDLIISDFRFTKNQF